MIKGYCRTNLDEFKRVDWPEKFVSVPRVGDYVEGKQGGPASRPRLRVAAVTHMMRKRPETQWSEPNEMEPIVEIELHR